jgi:vacuolar protein sorting-associated protein 45
LRKKNWDKYENYLFNRICDGIISVCLSNRLTPVIKTIKNGDEICSSIAIKVTEFFANNMDFLKRECGRDYNGLLVIFDRREDPITPLLNQWTYQAMIHELIGINNNILEIKHGNNNKSEKLVLSDYEDKFFAANIHSDFGEVANNIKVLIDDLNNEQKLFDKKTETIEDLKKMIDLLPEKKKQSAEVTKHTNIIYELTDLMHKKNLLEISSLEQDIACNNNKKDQFSKIINIVKDHLYSNLDKAKICLLYAFRYEGDPTVKQLTNIMENNNLKEYIKFIDYLVEFAGSDKRRLDVLSNKDFLSKGKSIFFQAFKNIPNVFTQHMSYLTNVLGTIIRGDDKQFETYYPLQREKDK